MTPSIHPDTAIEEQREADRAERAVWLEENERRDRMSAFAIRHGLEVETFAGPPPPLNPDGSLKDHTDHADDQQTANRFNPNQKRCDDGKWGCGGPSKTTGRGEVLHSVTRGEDKIWRDHAGREAPEHIAKLGIPPAWKDVYANPNPNGTLMATGVDAKGRTQMRYSSSFTAKTAAAKFGRVTELRKKRQAIFSELEKDAKNPLLRDRAECLKVVMQTGMRPGSDSDTKADHRSYGATTLEGRHVIDNGDGTATLRLVTGKNKGREVDFPIADKKTSAMLIARAKNVGNGGRLFATTAQELRTYSKSKDGGGFKTKDHRTALGTETAIAAIKESEPPTTAKAYKAAVKEVAGRVSKVLGNTPAIALKSYIDPQVFAGWRKGAGV